MLFDAQASAGRIAAPGVDVQLLKLQFGAGLDGPAGWVNVDASPTLWLQRLPLVGRMLGSRAGPVFSPRIEHGNMAHGLKYPDGSAELVFSSHALEHMSHADARAALREAYRLLRPGGTFRSVLPDLRVLVERYVRDASPDAAGDLMRSTLLGTESRPRGLGGLLRTWFGNSPHLWMWDYPALENALLEAGFVDIRPARFNDSDHPAFAEVELPDRWVDAVGFECRRP